MQEKKTISDLVYDKILENIVTLEYEPGRKLSEVQLAQELEVSRAPIKSALAKLEKEGFVKIKPQNGTFVSHISLNRACEICDIRILLENHAVRIAAEQISPKQMVELQELLNQMDQFKDEDVEFIYAVDGKLHDMIYRIGGSEILQEIIERYRPEIQRIQRANMTWVNRKKPTQAEMRRIIKAIMNHDPDEAVEAMTEHLSQIKKAVETYQGDS